MEKLYTSKTFFKMADGRMHTPHPPPGSVPRYKLQKPSKEYGVPYFSHSAPLVSLFLTRRQSQKGKHGTLPPPHPKYAAAYGSLRLGACERISSFK